MVDESKKGVLRAVDDRQVLAEFVLSEGRLHEDEVEDAGDRLGNVEATSVVMGVLAEVVRRKYSSPLSLREIVEYSRDLAGRHADDESPLRPLMIEALMRVMFTGETGLIDWLDPNELLEHVMEIACDLFASLGLDDDGFNDMVTEALKLGSEVSAGAGRLL